MQESSTTNYLIASRYAKAVFEIGKENFFLDELLKDIEILKTSMKKSRELRLFFQTSLYTRKLKSRLVLYLGPKMQITQLMINSLALMAFNGRLSLCKAFLNKLSFFISSLNDSITVILQHLKM